MAGVNYEVNIQLNAKTLDKQLGDLEKRVNNLKKNLAAPLRGQDQASRQSVARAEKAAKLEDRIRATRVITFNLGRRLNRLEERGIKVNEQRVQLNRAATSTNKKLVEQARTQNKLVREFVQAEERKLKLGVRAGRMQAENIDAAVSAREKRYSLDQKLRRLEEEGIKTDKLRSRFGDMTEAHRKHEFGLFKQIARELELSVRRERDKLALQKRQTRELQRQARMRGAVSPIGGAAFIAGSPAQIAASARTGGARSSIRGDINTPGSPAFIEAQQRELSRLARQGGARSPIQGSADIPGSPAFITAQAQERDKALRRAAQLGGARSSITGDVNTPGSPAFVKAQQAELIRLGRIGGARSAVDGSVDIPGSPAFIRAQARERQKALREAAAMGGPRSPIMGGVSMPGSPLAMQAARRRRSKRMQGVALGAGFPLLFGGGPGAILGGAAGGLVGGPAGFAAQIALSAIGQQFDKVAAAAFETGRALTSTGGTLEFMREKSLFSTTAIEDRAIALEEQGKVEELAALTASDLAKTIGTDGVKALQDLGRETNETAKQWNILTTQLFALVAGPLKEFLKIVNSLLGGITSEQKLGALKRNVTGTDLERLNQIEREVRGVQKAGRSKGQLLPLTTAKRTEILRRAAEQGITMPTISAPITGEDLRTITPPEAKKPKKGRRSRLGDFQADLAQAQELFTFEKSIYQARFNDDRRALIRFEKVRELLSIREKEQTVVASDRSEAEKKAQLDALALERKRASLEETYKLAELERTMGQERGKAMLVAIEQQNQLNLGLQQQLQLADSLSQVLGQGLTRSFDLLIDGAQNWGMALRDIAANVLRDIARQLIQIYVIEQAVGFLRQAFGPGPQFGPNYSVNGVGTAGPNFGIPQRARGGAVSANQPYMVGERGPELFVPGASGNIVPNHAMGGVEVGSINITVENTGDQLSPAAQKQIANQVQGIVMSTLVNERRSGGVLR